MAKRQGPEVHQVSSAQVEALLVKLRALLPPETYSLLESLLRTLLWIMEVLEQKKGVAPASVREVWGGDRVGWGDEINDRGTAKLQGVFSDGSGSTGASSQRLASEAADASSSAE